MAFEDQFLGREANQFSERMFNDYLNFLAQQQQYQDRTIGPGGIGLYSQLQGVMSFPQMMSSGPGGLFGVNGPMFATNMANQQAAVQNRASMAPVLQQAISSAAERDIAKSRFSALNKLADNNFGKGLFDGMGIRGKVGDREQNIGEELERVDKRDKLRKLIGGMA